MTLKQLVARKLAESGITPQLAAKLCIEPKDAAQVTRLPNIAIAKRMSHNPAMIIPYWDLNGKGLLVEDVESGEDIPMYRVRYLPPVVYADGSEQKYNQPARIGCPPYLAPLEDWAALAINATRDLWITEGEFKSIAATNLGQPTIGLGGVWNFRGKDRPLSDIFYEFTWTDREVVLVYDSDIVSNHNVRYACDAIARELQSLGAVLFTIIVPALPARPKTGLDDFLREGNPKKNLEHLRSLKLPWADTTLNDSGNANIFTRLHGKRLFYCRQERQWRLWNEKLWVPDRSLEALALTEDVSAQLHLEAASLKEKKARGRAHNWATLSGSEAKRNSLLHLAEAKLVRDATELDTESLMFNCQNGVLNLETFRLLPHDPTRLIGRISPVTFDPKARCPRFISFLEKFLPNPQVRKFIQRMAGYAMTNETGEHCFFIFHGGGRNGKSTLMEVLMYVWGDYARAANGDTFLTGRRVGTTRDDLHALMGARLVKAVETGKNARLDEPTIKEHTGGDAVTSRALYGKQTTWLPSHKLILVSNYKPHIEGTDEGIWSRVRFVPFGVVIQENEKILDYFKKELRPEASGILNWAVEGLRDYRQKGGLAAPTEVTAATQEYRNDENVVQQFLEAKCTAEKNPKNAKQVGVTPEQLQAAFKDYCQAQGIPRSGVNLKSSLEQLGYRQHHGHGPRYWLGIQIRVAMGKEETEVFLRAAKLKGETK